MRVGAGTPLSCSAFAQTKTQGPAGAIRVFQAPFVSVSRETPAGPPTAEQGPLEPGSAGREKRNFEFQIGLNSFQFKILTVPSLFLLESQRYLAFSHFYALLILLSFHIFLP